MHFLEPEAILSQYVLLSVIAPQQYPSPWLGIHANSLSQCACENGKCRWMEWQKGVTWRWRWCVVIILEWEGWQLAPDCHQTHFDAVFFFFCYEKTHCWHGCICVGVGWCCGGAMMSVSACHIILHLNLTAPYEFKSLAGLSAFATHTCTHTLMYTTADTPLKAVFFFPFDKPWNSVRLADKYRAPCSVCTKEGFSWGLKKLEIRARFLAHFFFHWS